MKRIVIPSVLLAAALVLGGCVDETGGQSGADHGKTSNEEEPTRVPPKGAGPISGGQVLGGVLLSPSSSAGCSVAHPQLTGRSAGPA